MYELIPVSARSYYMDCPAKVGFCEVGDGQAVLIDSGSDKDAAKKVKKILEEKSWKLKAIYITHSHADHIGGCAYLQEQTGCRIFAPAMEAAAACHPMFEPIALYGGNAMKDMQNKFLLAKPSAAEPLTAAVLPEGWEIVDLPGHSYEMVGYRTEENVVFLGDALAGEQTLEKYKISFLYDVAAYLETLEKVRDMKAACFVPSHAEPAAEIAALAERNIAQTKAVAETILSLLAEPMPFETLLAAVFRRYELTMNLAQRMLVGSTVKGYLTYWRNSGRLDYTFEDGLMKWFRCGQDI